MNKRLAPIPKGTILALTDGVYSDYRLLCLGEALTDLDPEALIESYLEQYPEQREDYAFSEWRFVRWLVVDQGLVKDRDYTEWHLADYSSAKEAWVDPHENAVQTHIDYGYCEA